MNSKDSISIDEGSFCIPHDTVQSQYQVLIWNIGHDHSTSIRHTYGKFVLDSFLFWIQDESRMNESRIEILFCLQNCPQSRADFPFVLDPNPGQKLHSGSSRYMFAGPGFKLSWIQDGCTMQIIMVLESFLVARIIFL